MTTADADIFLRGHRFVKAVGDGLRVGCGVQRGERLLVAVSGGRDSMALLRALHALAGRESWSLDLHVGHVNHHLRDAAAAEAETVAREAERLGLACCVRSVHPGEMAGNLEHNARSLRYEALGAMAREVGADGVVTAHHADDQLETVLMRLIRGAGPSGLAGMRAVSEMDGVRVLRPMLGIDGEAIGAFCEAAGVVWCEDASNRDGSRWRARLRGEVLPVLKALRGDASIKAAEAAEMLGETAAMVDAWVAGEVGRLCEPRGDGWTMRRAALADLPVVVRSGVIRRALWLGGVGEDRLPRRVCEAIAKAATDGGGARRDFDLAGGARVVVEGEVLRLERG